MVNSTVDKAAENYNSGERLEEGREARKCLAAGRSNFQSWLASMSFCQRQHVPAWTQRSVRSDRNSGETRETGKHRKAGELARLMVTDNDGHFIQLPSGGAWAFVRANLICDHILHIKGCSVVCFLWVNKEMG